MVTWITGMVSNFGGYQRQKIPTRSGMADAASTSQVGLRSREVALEVGTGPYSLVKSLKARMLPVPVTATEMVEGLVGVKTSWMTVCAPLMTVV
jgi:hypothetical protein